MKTHLLYFHIAIFFCLIYSTGIAVSNVSEKDSLLSLLEGKKSVEEQVALLDQLSKIELNFNLESSEEYAKKALELSVKNGLANGKSKALLRLGNVYFYQADFTKAIEHYQNSLSLSRLPGGDSTVLASNLNNLGTAYSQLGEVEKALSFFHESLTVKEVLGLKTELPSTYVNIGTCFFRLTNYEKALVYYQKAKDLYANQEPSLGLTQLLGNMGTLYIRQKNYGMAEQTYLEAIDIAHSLENKWEIARINNNLGQMHLEMGNIEKALIYSHKALSQRKRLKDLEGLALSYHYIGRAHEVAERYKLALTYFDSAMFFSEKTGSMSSLTFAHQGLYRINKQLKNLSTALFHLEKYYALKDSSFSLENAKLADELEAKYALEKKEREIELLKREREIQQIQLEQKSTEIKLYVISGMGLLFVLFFISLVIFRNRKRKYQDQLNQLRMLQEAKKEHQKDNQIEQQAKEEKLDAITVTVGDKINLVKIEDVVYFFAEDKYVFIRDRDNKKHIVDYTLSALESKLPKNFLRVSRSHIVNKDEIAEIAKLYNSKFMFVMKRIPGSRIPSSKKYALPIKEALKL